MWSVCPTTHKGQLTWPVSNNTQSLHPDMLRGDDGGSVRHVGCAGTPDVVTAVPVNIAILTYFPFNVIRMILSGWTHWADVVHVLVLNCTCARVRVTPLLPKSNNIVFYMCWSDCIFFCRKTGILVIADPPHDGVNNVERALTGRSSSYRQHNATRDMPSCCRFYVIVR